VHEWICRPYVAASLLKPVVLWTQKSDSRYKLQGLAGNISGWRSLPASRLPFVHSASSRIIRGAVDYDRVTGFVYWSQTWTGDSAAAGSRSIGAQRVTDALIRKSTPTMQFLSSWRVADLAVDSFTGNVYVTETERQLIAVARYDLRDPDMYRIIISSGLQQPTNIALDSDIGLVLSSTTAPAQLFSRSVAYFRGRLVGWVIFNGTYSINRLYRVMSARQII